MLRSSAASVRFADVTLKIYGHVTSGAQHHTALDLDEWLYGDLAASGPEMDLPRAEGGL